MMHRFAPTVLVFAIALGCGPSRPARVVPPDLDPVAVTMAIIAVADSDRDGVISRPERGAVPAFAAAFDDFDKNRDGRISADELRQWLVLIKKSKVAITSLAGEVLHLQRPLANATVKLIPEPFMGRGMQSAVAVTDSNGRFAAKMADGTFPGVNCGIYRVEITGTGNNAKALPNEYNQQSSLGIAVGGHLPPNSWVVFVLE